jgi:hypothetical protein
MRDPDVAAWIIDNVAPLLDIHEPPTGDERRELADLIVEAVEAAMLRAPVRDNKQRVMIATIGQSDFFRRLTQDHSA